MEFGACWVVVWVFNIIQAVFHPVKMDNCYVGSGLEATENAKYGNERKATGFPRVIERLFEKRKRKH